MQRRNLPAVVSPEVMVLERPIARPKLFKTIWTKFMSVSYQKTINALLPVMRLVDNSDLALVKSSKEGFGKVNLSLIDVWSGHGPFPSISEINRIIAQSGKERAGVPEMSLFAQEIEKKPIVTPSGDCLVVATRDSLQRGDVNQTPSVSEDEEHGVMLGLTYDWVVERHHVYVLVIDNI